MTFFGNNFDTRDIIAISLIAGVIVFGAMGIQNDIAKALVTLTGPVVTFYFKELADERRAEKEMKK